MLRPSCNYMRSRITWHSLVMQTVQKVITQICKQEGGFKIDPDPQRLLRTRNLRQTRIQVTDINATWEQVKKVPIKECREAQLIITQHIV